MRNFTWEVFSQTGDVELYLLYKEIIEEDLLQSIPRSPLELIDPDPNV